MTPFDPLQPLERGTNLIEASAGTGKTWTITALVVRLIIEEGLSLSEILVVTFTEAATAELQERIRGRLREAVQHFAGEGDPEDTFLEELKTRQEAAGQLDRARKDLRRAVNEMDRAGISTIHGFCNRSLHSNAFESGVLFDIELHGDLGHLLEEVVGDFWTRSLHDADPLFVRYLRRRKISPSDLMKLAWEFTSNPDAHVVGLRAGDPPPLDTDTVDTRYAVLRALWQGQAVGLERVLRGCGLRHKHWSLKRWVQRCDEWLDQDTMGPPPDELQRLTRDGLTAGASNPRLPQDEHLAQLLDAIEAFDEAWQELEPRLHEHTMHLQTQLHQTLRTDFQARKHSSRSWSYDDLLTELDAALQGPTGGLLAASLRAETKAVLVDEFQDTDPIQYRIFSEVFGGRDDTFLYLIGDPKQAIYAFRGADIFAYLRAVEDAGERRYTLTTNRRSDAPLVEAMNAVYARVVRPFVFEAIDYQPVDHAQPRRLFDDLAPLLVRWVDTRDRRYLQRGSIGRIKYDFIQESLPSVIAGDVARLLQMGATVLQDDKRVPLAPGHIAVLVRNNNEGPPIQNALRALGVDSVLHAASNVLGTDEAKELELVMAAVAEPANRSAVRTALTTEMLGRNANDIVALEAGEGQAWDRWVERFRMWRSLWEEQSFARMFRAMVETDDTLPRMLGMPDGERRMTNLLHLDELLSTEAARQDLGVAGLLRWFRGARRDAKDTKDLELRLESDNEAIQITTIHKAKGLEWPVVLCTGLFRARKGGKPPLKFHDSSNGDRLTLDIDKSNQARFERHQAMTRREERAEDARMLYVALTRARHRLVLYSSPLDGFERGPIAQLFHQANAPTPDQVLDATVEQVKKMNGRSLYQDLSLITSTVPGVQLWEPKDSPRPFKLDESVTGLILQARDRERTGLDPSWRIGSFSSLTRSANHAGPAAEGRDVDAHEPLPDSVENASPDILLGAFPKGAKAGTFFHDVYEYLDFTGPDQDLTSLVQQRLKLHGYDPAVWTLTVAEAFSQTLDTPLDETGWTLRQLSNQDRINELQFTIPVASGLGATEAPAHMRARVVPDTLAKVFRQHRTDNVPASYPDEIQALDFEPLHGFMTGFIDLIYRRDGRWWVVDYKSNHLGDQLADYAVDKLPEAMAHGHYFLQYHLYCVALHRMLQRRMADYDYASHFGGAQYLFIKGMTPEDNAGVFTDRPTLDMLRALEVALGLDSRD